MIEKALKYLIGLSAENGIFHDKGRDFSIKKLHPIPPAQADPLHTNNLYSVIDYLGINEIDKKDIIINVFSENIVKIYSRLNPDWKTREEYLVVENLNKHFFHFNLYHNLEQFIVGLQANFVQTDKSKEIIEIMSSMKNEDSKEFTDDGTTLSLTIKTGICRMGHKEIINPILLKPFRTFPEIDQPESIFILRRKIIDNQPCLGLFIADNNEWKIIAINNIRNYLVSKLGKEYHIIA